MFDDIVLLPKKGILESRDLANTQANLFHNFKIDTPFIAAPMPSVCDANMGIAINKAGGFGFIHRFMGIDGQVQAFQSVSAFFPREFEDTKIDCVGCAVGVSEGYERIEKLYEAGCRYFVVDVAHGHSVGVERYMENMDSLIKHHSKFVLGSVVTYEGAKDLIEWGANALRVGIGNGSTCTTTNVTGFGRSQARALSDTRLAVIDSKMNIPIIACGGIRNSGDVVKAIFLGADTVMLGSLLAGCDESPEPGKIRGASTLKFKYIEGTVSFVPKTGSVKETLDGLLDGVRSAISYSGGDKLYDLRDTIVERI